jgi:hypothetical protein
LFPQPEPPGRYSEPNGCLFLRTELSNLAAGISVAGNPAVFRRLRFPAPILQSMAVKSLRAMKKAVIILSGLLLCVAAATVIGQKKMLSPKQERREVREKRRAERIANYERMIDSIVLSRNFQFNPQTMQRQPAGPMRQVINPAFNVGIWDGTVDICLPYIKGYVPPYYATVINYTVSDVQGYTTEQTHEGWMVTFTTSLFSASNYTFTFEIFSRTGGANLTITNPWYNPVQYTGTISQLY